MRVIWFGRRNWDCGWTGEQQLPVDLGRRNHDVLYVDPDSIERPARLDGWRALAPAWTGAGIRRVAPRVTVYSHIHAPVLRSRLNQRRRPALLASVVRHLGFEGGIALTLHPTIAPLVPAANPHARVHYAVDEPTARPTLSRAAQAQVRALEDDLVRQADVVLGNSPQLVARLAEQHPHAYFQPSGAATDHFAPERLARMNGHPRLAALAHPRIGFIGQLDERLDQDLLVRLARRHREWQIVLVGRSSPGVDLAALADEPNLHLVGPVGDEDLPSAMRELDVGLVPYRASELTPSCSPLETYAYLAAGLPVVSRPLDGLGGCRDVIALADSADDFECAIAACLADSPEQREARLTVPAANSRDGRVRMLEARLLDASSLASAARHSRPVSVRPYTTPPFPESERPSAKARAAFLVTRAIGWPYFAARVACRALTGRRPLITRRILLVRRCRLGDLITLQPSIGALRARFPHAHIVLAVQPGAPTLLLSDAAVDEIRVVHPLDSLPRARRLAAHARLLWEGFDLVITGAGAMLLREAYFTGAPFIVGLDDGHPLQAWNTRRLPYDPARHESENNLALVAALGQRWKGAASIPRVDMPPELLERAWRSVCASLHLRSEQRIVTLHAGSQRPSRRWPRERFAELTQRLLAEDRSLVAVLTGTGDEQQLTREIADLVPAPERSRVRLAAGHTGFTALQALLRRSRVLVSNDTGVMHLARAMGVPLVALLGPENPVRWGPHPWGRAPAIALRYDVPCAPCLKWDCAELYCLRRLSVDEVLAATRALIEARPGSARFHPSRLIERKVDLTDLIPTTTILSIPSGAGSTPR